MKTSTQVHVKQKDAQEREHERPSGGGRRETGEEQRGEKETVLVHKFLDQSPNAQCCSIVSWNRT